MMNDFLFRVRLRLTPACAAGKRGHAFYAPVFQSAPRSVKPEA